MTKEGNHEEGIHIRLVPKIERDQRRQHECKQRSNPREISVKIISIRYQLYFI